MREFKERAGTVRAAAMDQARRPTFATHKDGAPSDSEGAQVAGLKRAKALPP